MKFFLISLILFLSLSVAGFSAVAEPVDPVSPDQRCAVCGMMVAKYNPWITQIHAAGEKVVMFDGVKDMMAYYFDPAAYTGKGDMVTAEIWVKDYYTLEYLDGRKAVYVVGSDVMGPMGEELVPFGSRKAS
jgi:copper chaperone NosL